MNEDEWRKNNWRCGHGWLRGEQCELCNAPKREWIELTDEETAECFEAKVISDRLKADAKRINDKLKEKNT